MLGRATSGLVGGSSPSTGPLLLVASDVFAGRTRGYKMWQHAGVIVLRSAQELIRWRGALSASHRIGFVPTMGFLHAGHVSLLEEGRRRVSPSEGSLVLSIFVNPTQFAPGEDLEHYPRDEPGDLATAEAAGVDAVFCPAHAEALYPTRATWVSVDGLPDRLCGAARPDHFRGVCTVVCKLWNLVRPDIGLFGEKDYQQLAILRRMHTDLYLGGEIVGMPIVREADGLALSSRNARLSGTARQDALALSRYLGQVRERFDAGHRDVTAVLGDYAQALAPGVVDYVEAVDADTLVSLEHLVGKTLVALAVHVGGVRLIDNLVLDAQACTDS